MKISNLRPLNFSSRNKYIRKADDIKRMTQATFPMTSSTYIKKFYKPGAQQDRVRRTISTTIVSMRNGYDVDVMIDGGNKFTAYKNILESIKKNKIGNCFEKSLCTLMVLFANGYYNSALYKPCMTKKETDYFYNTITKKNNLDHIVVATDLNTKETKDEIMIVIDPWLDFTDSVSGAKEKIKKNFRIINDSKLSLILSDFANAKDKIAIGEYIKKTYPELIISDTKGDISTPISESIE